MACFDTSFLIDLLKGKPEVAALHEELDESETRMCIAAPSIMELWSGACRSKVPEKEKSRLLELFQSYELLEFELNSAKEAGQIENDLHKAGTPIQPEDVMIGAISRFANQTLVTRDAHFTRIPGLRVLKY